MPGGDNAGNWIQACIHAFSVLNTAGNTEEIRDRAAGIPTALLPAEKACLPFPIVVKPMRHRPEVRAISFEWMTEVTLLLLTCKVKSPSYWL